MLTRYAPLALTLLGAACASGEVQIRPDGGVVDSLQLDLHGDFDPPQLDGRVDLPRPPDLGCVVGTTEHCAHCGDRCPGQDSDTLKRSCIDGRCALACREEMYDVNGVVDDGCEIEDDLPLHASEKDAQDLGKETDCSFGISVDGRIPSDSREHVGVPHERPNGRADYYSIWIDDDLLCDLVGEITLSLGALPTDAEYRVTTQYYCDNATPTSPRVSSGRGGDTVSTVPDTGCNPFGWGDDSGTLVIKIEKTKGPHSSASYTLTVTP